MVLALLLARRGVRVTLLEAQGDFDRAFRGDGLHPSVMELFDGLGLADGLLRLHHSRVSTITAHTARGPVTLSDYPGLNARYPYITILPQADLLDFLAASRRSTRASGSFWARMSGS